MSGNDVDVLQLELTRIEAINVADFNLLAMLLAEDYVHFHATGVRHTRAQLLENLRRSPRTIEPRTPRIQLFGELAVLTGPMTNHMTLVKEPQAATVHLYATQVARRTAGVWQFVSFEAIRL